MAAIQLDMFENNEIILEVEEILLEESRKLSLRYYRANKRKYEILKMQEVVEENKRLRASK